MSIAKGPNMALYAGGGLITPIRKKGIKRQMCISRQYRFFNYKEDI